MKVFRLNGQGEPLGLTEPVGAIGNFDGVHLGHRAVIDRARAAAERLHGALGIITFEPHPRAFFAPDVPPFRLMNAETRAHRLAKLGVDQLYELPFNANNAVLLMAMHLATPPPALEHMALSYTPSRELDALLQRGLATKPGNSSMVKKYTRSASGSAPSPCNNLPR